MLSGKSGALTMQPRSLPWKRPLPYSGTVGGASLGGRVQLTRG